MCFKIFKQFLLFICFIFILPPNLPIGKYVSGKPYFKHNEHKEIYIYFIFNHKSYVASIVGLLWKFHKYKYTRKYGNVAISVFTTRKLKCWRPLEHKTRNNILKCNLIHVQCERTLILSLHIVCISFCNEGRLVLYLIDEIIIVFIPVNRYSRERLI